VISITAAGIFQIDLCGPIADECGKRIRN
jgi:hypothetical protein